MQKLKYSKFAHAIDVDAFEEAIGFTPIDHHNGNDIGYCLFPDNHQHGDTTGKFAIHRGKKMFNCWACQGGSLLSLVMLLYDMEVEEATEWIHKFAHGDRRSDDRFLDEFFIPMEEKECHEIPYFNPRVLEKYTDDTSWFLTRGISQDVIDKYGLRYAKTAMRGAPIKNRNGETVKEDEDYYGPSAIVPHFWEDRLVGWQNRWMDWDRERTRVPKWLPKYTNTSDFPKKETLYNYQAALADGAPVVVCESPVTVLMLASLYIPAVAYFGSSPTEEQLRLLRRFYEHGLILAPDNDENGEQLLRTTDYLQRYVPEILHLPMVRTKPGADIADLYDPENKDYSAVWKHLNKNYIPGIF